MKHLKNFNENFNKKVSDADVQNIIDYLQGTCDSLQVACSAYGYDEDDLTMEQLEELDNQIFRCASCEWWCDQGQSRDVDGENYCDSCAEDADY